MHHAPVLLTEHGIYTREREEEIIRAEWVVPSFKNRWIRFFYMLSEEIYRRAYRVTSLFTNARRTQIEMGCAAEKCIVIPNGVQYERFLPDSPEAKGRLGGHWCGGSFGTDQRCKNDDLCVF